MPRPEMTRLLVRLVFRVPLSSTPKGYPSCRQSKSRGIQTVIMSKRGSLDTSGHAGVVLVPVVSMGWFGFYGFSSSHGMGFPFSSCEHGSLETREQKRAVRTLEWRLAAEPVLVAPTHECPVGSGSSPPRLITLAINARVTGCIL